MKNSLPKIHHNIYTTQEIQRLEDKITSTQ